MHPFEQQVRERAYFIWEGEGRVFGHATEHWLRAERELSADAPVQVRPVAAEISLAPSPARALKPKAAARSSTAKAVAATAKPVKAAAAKTTKTTATKAASVKTETAKAATTKSVSTKAAPVKAAPAKASRPKAFEAGVVMH